VVGDKLVVVGGWNMHGAGKPTDWHDTALVLDLAKATLMWHAVKQPFQRRALTATAHNGKVYVFGGMNDDTKTMLKVNIFDPASNAWTLGPDIPGPRRNGFTPASCSADGALYVSPADGRLLRLTRKHDAWEEVGQLKQPRIVHRMVPARENLLVVVGGASGGDNVALTEAIVPRTLTK
jgi:N-acetylneuraminic acid mutarotase